MIDTMMNVLLDEQRYKHQAGGWVLGTQDKMGEVGDDGPYH